MNDLVCCSREFVLGEWGVKAFTEESYSMIFLKRIINFILRVLKKNFWDSQNLFKTFLLKDLCN